MDKAWNNEGIGKMQGNLEKALNQDSNHVHIWIQTLANSQNDCVSVIQTLNARYAWIWIFVANTHELVAKSVAKLEMYESSCKHDEDHEDLHAIFQIPTKCSRIQQNSHHSTRHATYIKNQTTIHAKTSR